MALHPGVLRLLASVPRETDMTINTGDNMQIYETQLNPAVKRILAATISAFLAAAAAECFAVARQEMERQCLR